MLGSKAYQLLKLVAKDESGSCAQQMTASPHVAVAKLARMLFVAPVWLKSTTEIS